jgi:ribokinase
VAPRTDLVVIGDLMLDVTVQAGALARGGDVHGEVRLDPGGSAANVAVWAAEAGATVTLVGAVGDDHAGRILMASIRARGINAALAVSDTRTGMMLVLTEDGDRSMVANRGANSRLTAGVLPDPLEAAAVFVSGYTLFDPATTAVAVAALSRAQAPIIALDAVSWPLVERRGPAAFFEMSAGATVLFANEHEAEALTGRRDEEAARTLAERYRTAVVKLGARGAVAASDGRIVHAPAVPIVEVDSTGAGDAFDGACLAALVAGEALEAALERACASGARCAAQPGRWPEASGS